MGDDGGAVPANDVLRICAHCESCAPNASGIGQGQSEVMGGCGGCGLFGRLPAKMTPEFQEEADPP